VQTKSETVCGHNSIDNVDIIQVTVYKDIIQVTVCRHKPRDSVWK